VTAPSYQLMPPLDADAYGALKADIAARGVLVPVEVDEHGQIIDGHHRVRAWEELRAEGVRVPDYPRAVRAGLDEAEKRQLARALNLARRHLSRVERRALIGDAVREDPGASDRRLAATLGVSHRTVAAVRRRLVAAGDVDNLPTRTDTLGRSQPATRVPTVLVRGARDERRAREALVDLGADAPAGLVDLRAAERRARKVRYERRRDATQPASAAAGERWELRSGDFAEVLCDLADGCVDLVLTDPPYGEVFTERWGDLGALSARVLRPGGLSIFYIGHHNLPAVVDQLTAHLSWWWHVALVQPGHESRMHSVRVHNGHRDLLVLSNGPRTPSRWLRDTLTNPAPDKGLHEWQQAISAPRYLIDVCSLEGALVLDPCCGPATFGVAAIEAGRRFLGCDLDPVTLAHAAERLCQAGAPESEAGAQP
jgi:ParB-like chromosome segregation protein Spo0J